MENNNPPPNGNNPRPHRMGVLVNPPQNFYALGILNFNRCAIGVFVGPNPPPVSYVQHIVNQRWVSRAHVRVHRTGNYYIFECIEPHELDGLVRQCTSTFEGRLINLRRYEANLIPQQINFNTSRIWVRVYVLPLQFLTEAWARRIFCHLGYLDQLEPIPNGRLPERAELRARMMIDISLPLIPGCYIPLSDGRVIWVYFRLRIDVAARRLFRRLAAVERDGLWVLHGPLDYPYYTNYVQGFPNIFRHRNLAVNLTWLEEPEDRPLAEQNQEVEVTESDFNSNDSNDTVYFTGSDSSSGSEVEDGNAKESRIGGAALRLSPGRRIGLNQDPYAQYTIPNLNNPISPLHLAVWNLSP
uniref:FHA domain-containing protein n=1 Tax=Chenopodium quinoa TaxID=63459 RepID=A0A803LSV0_CHEQI